eukprot:6878248-Prymnesium_polylepis.2
MPLRRGNGLTSLPSRNTLMQPFAPTGQPKSTPSLLTAMPESSPATTLARVSFSRLGIAIGVQTKSESSVSYSPQVYSFPECDKARLKLPPHDS